MNKLKVISAISLGAALVSTMSFAKTGVVNVDEAVVRNDASTSSAVVMGIKKDVEVEIIEEKDGFYKINYNNTNGYVRSDLLTVVEETVEKAETTEENTVEESAEKKTEDQTEDNTDNQVEPAETIATDNLITEFPKEYDVTTNLNVYKLPACTSTKVTTIEAGNKITINKQVGNWSYITTDTVVGWIRNYNLTNSVETAEPVEDTEETQETEAEINKGYVNVGSVNVRKEESTDSEILTTLTRNTEVEVLAEVGNWYKIKYGETIGYIMQEYISDKNDETTSRSDDEREEVSVETTTKYVSVQLANVREKASASSSVISTLKQKSKVEVSGYEGDFAKVILDNGTTAYVASRLLVDSLDDIDEIPTRESSSSTSNSTQVYSTTGSSSGTGIVEFAQQFLGYSYVYGGTTPSGFDCSGFIYYVFNSCGYNISRSLTVQATTGTAVEKANLQLGDVIFFNNTSSGALGHVGIYIGDGRFIHAANPSRGVVTDTINSGYYYQYYYTARRIAN